MESQESGVGRAQQHYDYLSGQYEKSMSMARTKLGISCGQLASYAEHVDGLNRQTQERISEISRR